jgi:hypothetical protein
MSDIHNFAFDLLATSNRMATRAYGPAERVLDPPDTGVELTDAEINAVQAEVEQRASDECDECHTTFRDWLNSKPGQRTRQDYQQWRVAMLSLDEQREILEQL